MLATLRPASRLALALVCSASLCAFAYPQAPATASAPATGTGDPRRFDDLVALIEGPNLPLGVRRTGARELLRHNWPQRTSRLSAILAGDNQPARIAVAQAIADVPESREDAYVEPLMGMLLANDPEVSHAAAVALASYRDGGVVERLRAILLDEAQPLSARLAALDALGMMSQRAAVAVLVEALANPGSPICQPGLRALERATGTSFGDDLAAARLWWQRSEELTQTEWQQEQIERLVQKTREVERRLRGLEGRLVEAFRQDYIRAAEPDRTSLLQAYLRDESALVRLLGLELVHRHLGEGKEFPPDAATLIRDQARSLLSDGEPAVRAAAAQVVARFREPADAERFLDLLATERHVETRRALVNGLGHIGNGQVIPRLLEILQAEADPCRAEAATALGRLAERGVLTAPMRREVAGALSETFERTLPPLARGPATQSTLRERVLWAISVLGEEGAGQALVTALSEAEAPAVRQTAIRGLATLRDPQLLDALVPLTRDGDPVIRRTALEALANAGSTDQQLEALWERLDPTQESDSNLRQTAWRGARRVLQERALSTAQLEEWIARLPGNGEQRAQRTLELLEILEDSLTRVPEALAELGRVRARMAAQHATLGQTETAVATYLSALRDLHAAHADEAQPVARELFWLALRTGRYDQTMAAELARGNPAVDGAALWEEVKTEIEQRLVAGDAEQAIAMLEALRAHPPTAFTPELSSAMDALLARARAIRKSAASTAPASGPTAP